MFRRPHPPKEAKALADVLEDELVGEVGTSDTQASSEAEKELRLRAVYARIHALEPKRSALCLSGGGIRSASFGLGVLQALARAGVLEKFDYLSTVSGGGYIGGWLTAWMRNHPEGREGVLRELKTARDSPLAPEREPIRHVRAFSNYLTPQIGLFSADTWTLGATLLRNMFLNWIVLVSWLAALLLIPRFTVLAALAQPGATMLHALLVAAFVGIAAGTAYAAIDLPSLGNARWMQRRFIPGWLIPMFGGVVCFLAWWAGYRNSDTHGAVAVMLSTSGLHMTQIFVGAATAAGCVVAAGVVTYRTRAQKEARPAFSRLIALAGILLVTVLLTGVLSGYFGWWVAARVFPDPARDVRSFVCFAPPLLFGLYFAANALFIGLSSWFGVEEDREWWGRAGAWLCITIVAWAALHALVLWVPLLIAQIDLGALGRALLAAVGGVLGLFTAVFGFRAKSAILPASDTSHWRTRILAATALGFFVLLSCALSRLLDAKSESFARVDQQWWDLWERTDLFELLLYIALFIGAGLGMGFFINVNRFSLHAMYRNRLIRAFLGASRTARQPHWFTGFDPEDNFKAHEIPPGRPLHVINIALNLVQGRQLAWQERMAASFTVTRLHSGSWLLGYRPSKEYGAGISVGSALAISGAAASPNQGYHSSPLVAFVMTLFNVRLGWWLGNPGEAGARTWWRRGPWHAALPLFAEAFGNTTASDSFVNLSDGGHFDNLGLYEMILRRCRYIVAIDAGCDQSYIFEDLGNVIRKVRIDLGIPIDIRVVSPKKEGAKASYYVLGTIRYSAIDGPGTDGELLYIKPILCGQEPADVSHYAAAHPEFPHEPTSDQWFSESQLESYRALGVHAVGEVCQGVAEGATLAEFFQELKQRSAKAEPSA